MSDVPLIDPKAYGLDHQMSRVVRAANRSSDAVSMVILGKRESNPEGAIAVLRGRETVLLFEQWAVRNKVLDPDRSDGLVDALESGSRRAPASRLHAEVDRLEGLLEEASSVTGKLVDENEVLRRRLGELESQLEQARAFAESYSGTPTPWSSGR